MSLYPTPNGQRIPYDRDGSAPFYINSGGTVTSYTTAQGQQINNETGNQSMPPSGTAGVQYLGVVFSHLWDLTGYFLCGLNNNATFHIQTSVNTTNGADGTWVDQGAATYTGNLTVSPAYRSSIVALSVAGIKGVRITADFNTGTVSNFHLYGNPSSGSNPDSLRIWQPVTNAELTTVVDFGDIARGTSATQQFRVHNQSATKTASSITVSMEALTDSSPSQIGQYQLSTDNITYANSISIPNLGPGATSAVLYVRDSVASGAQTSVWAARIVAAAGTFA